MYAVSDDFPEAVQKNTRNYYWSDTIVQYNPDIENRCCRHCGGGKLSGNQGGHNNPMLIQILRPRGDFAHHG